MKTKYYILLIILTYFFFVSFRKKPHESRKVQFQKYLAYKYSPDSISIEKIRFFDPVQLFKGPKKKQLVDSMIGFKDSVLLGLKHLIDDNKDLINNYPDVKVYVENEISLINKERKFKTFIIYFMQDFDNGYSFVLQELEPILSSRNNNDLSRYKDKIAKAQYEIHRRISSSTGLNGLCFLDVFSIKKSFYEVTYRKAGQDFKVLIWADLKCHLYCMASIPKEIIKK